MSGYKCLSVETREVSVVAAAPARDGDGRSWWRRLAALPDRPCAEVVTNALAQTREPIRLCLTWVDALLRIEVEERGSKQALPRQMRLPDPSQESGRGLFLLDALACCWGVEYTTTGKTVWFELPASIPGNPV